MSRQNRSDAMSRRDLLKAGSAAAAMAAGASILNAAELAAPTRSAGQALATAPASQPAGPLPTRLLGKTGAKVTVINLGCGGQVSQRLLDQAYDQGIRYFDTAGSYSRGKTEQLIGAWFERTGKRKQIFMVTKARPFNDQKKGDLNKLLTDIDTSLEALKTDYIDLYLIQGVSVKDFGDQAADWPRSEQFKDIAGQLKKSGKARFVGFSCHDAAAAPQLLEAAADGGFIDAIMISYNPVIGQADNKLSQALDACHKAGIGLIAMKTRRGIGDQLKAKLPEGESLAKAVIQTVLSDERIATICSAMNSQAQIDENTAAARAFTKPLPRAELDRLRGILLAAGWTFCPGCDACREGIAATHPHVHDVTRYLSYFEQDGLHAYARQRYRALPAEVLHVPGAALEAARQACALHVDYPSLLRQAALKLA
jgi:aryl-alcohol dehydrogenase-like predicted oxidoreductase